ncbi:Na+/H+ antiporter NhaA [Methylobacterium sp. SyP6R]|uniref:Na+/H+ antiporter NhaA n=1 Tax=Methylobacterium sp. SyP6R TaxID=2718876 RepID=UPI003018DE18
MSLGKQVGVFGGVRLAVRTGLAQKPAGATWRHVYGEAFLCGIGFIMSLFIGGLARATTPEFDTGMTLGVIVGSVLSTPAGALVLSRGAAAGGGTGRAVRAASRRSNSNPPRHPRARRCREPGIHNR